jgi:hypothetical protein
MFLKIKTIYIVWKYIVFLTLKKLTAHQCLDSTDKPFNSVDILFYKSIRFIPKQSNRAFVYPESSICFTLFTLQGSANSKPYHL